MSNLMLTFLLFHSGYFALVVRLKMRYNER